jgi:hypothetical protein
MKRYLLLYPIYSKCYETESISQYYLDITTRPPGYKSRTCKVRGKTASQVNGLIGHFEPWKQTFPPQIIQVLLKPSCPVHALLPYPVHRSRPSPLVHKIIPVWIFWL